MKFVPFVSRISTSFILMLKISSSNKQTEKYNLQIRPLKKSHFIYVKMLQLKKKKSISCK